MNSCLQFNQPTYSHPNSGWPNESRWWSVRFCNRWARRPEINPFLVLKMHWMDRVVMFTCPVWVTVAISSLTFTDSKSWFEAGWILPAWESTGVEEYNLEQRADERSTARELAFPNTREQAMSLSNYFLSRAADNIFLLWTLWQMWQVWKNVLAANQLRLSADGKRTKWKRNSSSLSLPTYIIIE